MKSKKILFVTQEITPYTRATEFAKMGRELPLACLDKGYEIRAFMPKWGSINERRNQLHEVKRLSGLNIIIDGIDHPLIIKVASVAGTRMQVYFIDNEDYFAKRLEEQDEKGNEYDDNFERGVFYARGVLETVKKLRWTPDIINAQGWVASALPYLLKTEYADEACFRKTCVVCTVSPNKLTFNTPGRLAAILGEGAAQARVAEEFGESLTPRQVDMFAIKYSDGVCFTQAEPDESLVQAAEGWHVPVLRDVAGTPDQQIQFFNQIWEQHNPPVKD